MVRRLTVSVTFALTVVAVAPAVTGAASAAEASTGPATRLPAQRQRPSFRASLPDPGRDARRCRPELCPCTVERSLRHACGVSCRVRAGELPGRGCGFTPRSGGT